MNKIIGVIALFVILSSGFSNQSAAADSDDIRKLNLPAERLKLADEINSYYYNLQDKNINNISFEVYDSWWEKVTEKAKGRGYLELAADLGKMKFFGVCSPDINSVNITVSNKPKDLSDKLKELIKDHIDIYEIPWKVVSLSFMPKEYTIEEVVVADDSLLVKTINDKGEKNDFLFDKKYKCIAGFFHSKNEKVKINISIFQSKYLIEEMAYDTMKAGIQYQTINGIKVPNKLLVESADGVNKEIIFKNITIDYIK